MSINKRNYVFLCCVIVQCISLSAWFFHYKPIVLEASPKQASVQTKIINFLLVPAGDARNNGRNIVHQFESSCMMMLVQELKDALEQRYNSVRVLLSHGPGEVLQPWRVATMANTLDIDLVLQFNCYHEQGPKPTITIYEFSYGNDFVSKLVDLSWYSVDQAYLCAAPTMKVWLPLCMHELAKPINSSLSVHGPYKIPFAPLLGIKVPAFGFEMSLKDDQGYKEFINPLVMAMSPIVDLLLKQRTIQESA